jgi:hypothetical protein
MGRAAWFARDLSTTPSRERLMVPGMLGLLALDRSETTLQACGRKELMQTLGWLYLGAERTSLGG